MPFLDLSFRYANIVHTMLSTSQIFIVVDIETDGPAVGIHSMLSLGAVATTTEKEIAQFYRTITPLENAKQDAETMRFWDKNPEAWLEVNTNQQPPQTVISNFYKWIINLGVPDPIFVSSPIGLDYTFVSWYLFRFASANPFIGTKNDLRTLDVRSYIAGRYGFSYDNSSRLKWPSDLVKNMPVHNHRAIDDALGYAFLLRKILHEGK